MSEKGFVTHNEKDIPFESSCLIGFVDIEYSKIKDVFGKPFEGDGYKTDAEWEILFDNGDYATIYNYKDGINYNGKFGTPETEITEWHIGGYGSDEKRVRIVEKVKALLGQ
jgi:hypothetical protein